MGGGHNAEVTLSKAKRVINVNVNKTREKKKEESLDLRELVSFHSTDSLALV